MFNWLEKGFKMSICINLKLACIVMNILTWAWMPSLITNGIPSIIGNASQYAYF